MFNQYPFNVRSKCLINERYIAYDDCEAINLHRKDMIKVTEKDEKEFIEPLIDCSYEDFPEDKTIPDGIKNLDIPLTPINPTVQLNVPYAVKSGITLHLHIITPPVNQDDTRQFPLIMWVQGSAFHKQDTAGQLPAMIEAARRGFVVAMVEYRWAPDNPFPAQIKDLKTATRFMLSHANQYHVDPQRYLAWGNSSGGHTVSMAVVTANMPEFDDEDPTVMPLNYRCCIDYYGPTDISRMNKVPSTQDHVTAHSLEGEFFGTNNVYEVPKMVQKGNPITYVTDKKLPPFLIMHGNHDRFVPFNQSVLFYKALKQHNQNVTFYRLNHSDHTSDTFYSKESFDITFDFINKYI